jgi:hypothetical protein
VVVKGFKRQSAFVTKRTSQTASVSCQTARAGSRLI